MTDTTKPEALRLAAILAATHFSEHAHPAAAELRRLHAENEVLRKSLRAMFNSFGTHEDSGNRAMFDDARAAMKEKP